MTFTPNRSAWYNNQAFEDTYESSLPNWKVALSKLVETMPVFPDCHQILFLNSFMLFLACFPFKIMFEIFAYSNAAFDPTFSNIKITFDNILRLMIFQMERHGLSDIYGSLSTSSRGSLKIMTNSTYNKLLRNIVYAKERENESAANTKARLSQCSIRLAHGFSEHSSCLV